MRCRRRNAASKEECNGRHVVILVGDSNLHYSDECLPSFLGCVTPACVGALFHCPSTAGLVRAALQRHGRDVYEVGWSRLKQYENSYNMMNLESVLRAAHKDGSHVSMVLSLGQNDCFSTRTSQSTFKKEIAHAIGALAHLVDPYVNVVFVIKAFDQEQRDSASYFGVEYDQRVEALRRAWEDRVRRDKKWTSITFAPPDDAQWLPDHLHLRPQGRSSFAEAILAHLQV